MLLQQKRIFTPAKTDGVYWTINILIYMTLAFYLATTLSFIFQCWPREAIWNLGVKGVCINSIAATYSCGVINLLSDTATLALPLWAIWHLQMPIKRKLPVYAIFGTGLLYATTIHCITSVLSLTPIQCLCHGIYGRGLQDPAVTFHRLHIYYYPGRTVDVSSLYKLTIPPILC